MTTETHISTFMEPQEVDYYPQDGAFVCGLYIEGSRYGHQPSNRVFFEIERPTIDTEINPLNVRSPNSLVGLFSASIARTYLPTCLCRHVVYPGETFHTVS